MTRINLDSGVSFHLARYIWYILFLFRNSWQMEHLVPSHVTLSDFPGKEVGVDFQCWLLADSVMELPVLTWNIAVSHLL